MRAAVSKAEIEAEIASRFVDAFKLHEKAIPETYSTGITAVDNLFGGVPRGALTEIFGRASSGRTSLMFSMLAYATTHDEICALVDTSNVFAPTSAARAGIDFDRLLWIRCNGNIEYAFKATDLLLHAGGFGLLILDIGDVAGKDARRIITSWWYRFRRAVEDKPTAIVVISEEACTRSCAALTWELNGTPVWSTPGNVPGSEDRFFHSGNGKILPIRNQFLPENSSPVSHANVLRANSITVDRRRPITAGMNAVKFGAVNPF